MQSLPTHPERNHLLELQREYIRQLRAEVGFGKPYVPPTPKATEAQQNDLEYTCPSCWKR